MRVIGYVRSFEVGSAGDRLDTAFRDAAKELGSRRISEIERFVAEMDSELLLAYGESESGHTGIEPGSVLTRAVQGASVVFSDAVEQQKRSLQGPFARWRRFMQRVVLFLPVPLFLLKIANRSRIEDLIDAPSLVHALSLLVSCLTSLFGSEGLTGLLVLLIIQAVLVVYLAGRRLNRIERQCRSLAHSALKYLEVSLRYEQEAARKVAEQTIERISRSVARLTDLESRFRSEQA
jgi:hypothetical protein